MSILVVGVRCKKKPVVLGMNGSRFEDIGGKNFKNNLG